MNDNIQVINKAGEGMFTEGLSYIEIPSTGKKYVFYTLNEKVENDLNKIYIAETNPEASVENTISDLEWEDLRQKMIKISHKENVEDVNFLSMNDVKFNVGEPKKLAITAVAKQAFKDAQISHTMATNQTATPVTNGSGSSFFNQEVVGTQTNQVEGSPVEQNIFANPLQPENAIPSVPAVDNILNASMPAAPTSIATSEGTSTPAVEGLTPAMETPIQSVNSQIPSSLPTEQPMVTTENLIGTPNQPEGITLEQNQVAAPATTEPATPITSNTNAPALDQPAVEQVQEIAISPIENNELLQLDDKPIVESNKPSSNGRPIITDEEALKAINIIQEYINQESENNNQ